MVPHCDGGAIRAAGILEFHQGTSVPARSRSRRIGGVWTPNRGSRRERASRPIVRSDFTRIRVRTLESPFVDETAVDHLCVLCSVQSRPVLVSSYRRTSECPVYRAVSRYRTDRIGRHRFVYSLSPGKISKLIAR